MTLTSHTLEIGGPAARPPTARHRVQTGWRPARRPGGDGGLHPASTRAPARISRPRRYRRDVLSLITARWETIRRGPASGRGATRRRRSRPSGSSCCWSCWPPFRWPRRTRGWPGPAQHRDRASCSASARSPGSSGCGRSCRYRLMVTALSVMAVAGGTLAGLSPFSTAIAVGCVVTSSAGVRLSTEASLTDHRRDRGRLPDRGLHGRGAGRNAGRLPGRDHRPVGVRPDPPRLPAPGRGGRGGAGAGPPGARGREPGVRAGRAGADRPGDPRRARPLPRRRLGQPAGGRGPAGRAAAPTRAGPRW